MKMEEHTQAIVSSLQQLRYVIHSISGKDLERVCECLKVLRAAVEDVYYECYRAQINDTMRQGQQEMQRGDE